MYLNSFTRQAIVLPASWGRVPPTLIVVGLVVGLVVPLRRLTKCLRAPRRLVGVVGVPAVNRPYAWELGTARVVTRLTTDGGEVLVSFLNLSRFPPPGTVGTLYRRGRTAAFVTDTDTFWAV